MLINKNILMLLKVFFFWKQSNESNVVVFVNISIFFEEIWSCITKKKDTYYVKLKNLLPLNNLIFYEHIVNLFLKK